MALRQEDLKRGQSFMEEQGIELTQNDINYFKSIEAAQKGFKIDKEAERELKRKAPLYRMSMFSEKKLIEMQRTIFESAPAIGGLPKHHSEALEKRGWMFPFLLGYDQLMHGRWDYWLDIMMKGTLEGSGPIPQLDWCTNHTMQQPVRKMLQSCMDGVYNEGVTVNEFADWLLWGLAGSDEPPKISAKVNEHWYRTFDLALVLLYPTDYLSGLLEEMTSMGRRQALGYFSTPPQITQMMSQMVAADSNPEDMKMQSVLDCCVGCGAMLLPMSNYSLFASGQDINPIAVKLCKVQFLWYAPWYARNPFQK